MFGLIICSHNTCCITHQLNCYDYIWLGLHQFLINWYGVMVDWVTTTNSNKLLSIQQTDSRIQTNINQLSFIYTTNNKILYFLTCCLGVTKNINFLYFRWNSYLVSLSLQPYSLLYEIQLYFDKCAIRSLLHVLC